MSDRDARKRTASGWRCCPPRPPSSGIVAGRFTGNTKAPPDMDALLQAWSGDAGDSDCNTSSGARLRAPLVTIGVFVQPQVFREMGRICGADEKGLLSRFLVAVVPSVAHDQAVFRRPADPERKRASASRIQELLTLRADREERTIALPTELLGPASAFHEKVTPQMATGGELSLPSQQAFASTLRGQMHRLIGLLHVADHRPDAPDIPCAEDTVHRAARLSDYFPAHGIAARREVATDDTIVHAQRLVDHLRFHRLDAFSRRDAQMGHWGGCRHPDDLDQALSELQGRWYMIRVHAERTGSGAAGALYRPKEAKLHLAAAAQRGGKR